MEHDSQGDFYQATKCKKATEGNKQICNALEAWTTQRIYWILPESREGEVSI